MTIGELETALDMTRANIRFYEQEGFIQPRRGANNYRDYSQEDADTLRKVKLLRQLGLSLEEIRQAQRGERPLSDLAAEREEALERQLLRQLGLTVGGGAAAVTVTFGPQAREGCAVYLTPDCARRQRVDYIWRDGESPAPEEPLLAALHRAGRLPDVGVKSAETLDIGP